MVMIEILVNDRLGRKIRVKCKYVYVLLPPLMQISSFCSQSDTIGEVKKLISAQTVCIALYYVHAVVASSVVMTHRVHDQRRSVYRNGIQYLRIVCVVYICLCLFHELDITLDDYEIQHGQSLELYYN